MTPPEEQPEAQAEAEAVQPQQPQPATTNNAGETKTTPSSSTGTNNNNEESLGEIWFDRMRNMRSRGQGGSNSTPSSPTNSSEGQDGGEGDGEEEDQGRGQDQTQSEQEEQGQTTDTLTTTSAIASKAKPNTARGGYQSDDEGFHCNYKDNDAASSSNSSSYLDAVKLLDMHKKAQAEEDHRQKRIEQQQGQSPPEPPKRKRDCNPAPETTTAKKARSNKGKSNSSTSTTSSSTTKKKQKMSPPSSQPQPKVQQRLERNAREKQRSGKITDQFQQLKEILTQAGVVVPKGTKGSILSIAHEYILTMKHQQQQKEQDNYNLRQQILQIANGSLGTPTAQALQKAAVHNGIDIPLPMQQQQQASPTNDPPPFDPLTVVRDQDYQQVWDSCPFGIAIATMGGTFLDCNQCFSTLLQCSKDHLRNISVFHLLQQKPNQSPAGKSNLQVAFEKISQLLETIQHHPSQQQQQPMQTPIVLPGSVQGKAHLGLGISLVQSAMTSNSNSGGTVDGHHLCITLLQSGGNGNGTTAFQPATLDMANMPRAPAQPQTNDSTLSTQQQQQQQLPPPQAQQQLPMQMQVPMTMSAPQQQTQQQTQQHALTTILTNMAAIPNNNNATGTAYASSSLSSSGSSGSSDHAHHQNQQQQSNNNTITNPSDKQHQQGESEASRYYTVG